MDEGAFRKHLKDYGKKEHVIEGLIAQVKQFEEFLVRERGITLEVAGPNEAICRRLGKGIPSVAALPRNDPNGTMFLISFEYLL